MFDWSLFSEVTQQKSIEEKEEEFNNVVRENIINLLTFIVLYICAYFVVARFHQKKERDGMHGEDEDAKAYRISFYLCTFTLAVSIGSVLMLPMSMIGNEVVHLFPDSYWVQWLNGALVHTFWKWMFYLSNLSLFVLLPFSYFFTESEGFTGQRRGLMPRVYETIAVLLLLALLVFGLAVLALAFFDNDDSALDILFTVGEYYLQYLYSFLLCLCMLFIITGCAPFGFLVLFDAVGQYLVKPKFFGNNDTKILTAKFEEEATKQKLKSEGYMRRLSPDKKISLERDMESARRTRIKLERRKNASFLERNLGYPLVVLIILALTGLAFLLVSFHIVKLVFIGDNELHPGTVTEGFKKDYRNINRGKVCQKPDVLEEPVKLHSWWRFWSNEEKKLEKQSKLPDQCQPRDPDTNDKSLGATSLSSFGIFGTVLEVLVIFYLTIASVVGLYHLPGFRRLRPELRETTMTKIIMNCLVVQLLSSSLPVLSRVLGITDFELQGSFGDLYWLGNFYVVFGFNIIFAAVTALCLVNKMTKKVRRELIKALRELRFVQAFQSRNNRQDKLPSSPSKLSPSYSTPETSSFGTPEPSTPKSNDVTLRPTPLQTATKQLKEKIASLENDLNRIQEKHSGLEEERPYICCAPSRNSSLTSRAIFKKDGNTNPK